MHYWFRNIQVGLFIAIFLFALVLSVFEVQQPQDVRQRADTITPLPTPTIISAPTSSVPTPTIYCTTDCQ